MFSPPGQEPAATTTGGWAQALREMSGQAFGSFEETGRQHLHTVLAKMDEDVLRAQDLQRRAETKQTSY